jgi:thiol-disulfide isomerase/thioredoxin
MIRRLSVVCVLALGCGGSLLHAGEPASIPPIFSTTTLAEAIAKSRKTSGVVVADFTAEWCAPCKMMERTVFRDPRVEKWAKDHGAVMIRIDTDQNAVLRTEYAVSAWPTFIGFKHGEMIDRRLGSMTTDQFLTWLERVDRAGKAAPGTETVVLPAPVTPHPVTVPPVSGPSPLAEFHDQFAAARAAREAGKFDKALADLLRLWSGLSAGEDRKRAPLLRSVLGEEMRALIERHAPARTPILAERDRLESALKSGGKTFDDLDGWLELNSVLGDEVRTLAWFDRVKSESDSVATLEQAKPHLRPALERSERWGDMLRFIPDPLADLHHTHAMCLKMPLPERTDEKTRARMLEGHRELFRHKAAELYVGLLMAGRDGEAGNLAAEAIRLDDTPTTRIALVNKAVRLGQGRKAQLALLDEAAKGGTDVGDLRKRVAAAPK